MRLNLTEIETITNDFYSCFCGINLNKIKKGVFFVCSDARDEKLKGFGSKYSIYVLVKEDVCIISYSPKYNNFFKELKNISVCDILKLLDTTFKIKKMQLMKFKQELVFDYGNAKVLKKEHYPLYEEFFRLAHPNIDSSGWLYEHFNEKVEKEYFTGYFKKGKLVSVCDAPDMPYMEDIIQHTGIVTLKQERRKGYAKHASALSTYHLIENGICPQWECRIENIASIALAESIGYEKYAIAYILEE